MKLHIISVPFLLLFLPCFVFGGGHFSTSNIEVNENDGTDVFRGRNHFVPPPPHPLMRNGLRDRFRHLEDGEETFPVEYSPDEETADMDADEIFTPAQPIEFFRDVRCI